MVHDSVQVDIATGKIQDTIRFDTGNLCMITGGANSGRVGTIMSRERHQGSFDIVHIKDSNGHVFATRLAYVFVIGKGNKPYISLPKGKGIKLSIAEERSKCRFLTRGLKGSLVITDLGMDRVYILDLVTKGVSMFGHSGSGPGCFKDPAGLAVDSMGNMLIADSRNHRLCLHDFKGRFLTEVKLDPPPKRPSGLLLDQEN